MTSQSVQEINKIKSKTNEKISSSSSSSEYSSSESDAPAVVAGLEDPTVGAGLEDPARWASGTVVVELDDPVR